MCPPLARVAGSNEPEDIVRTAREHRVDLVVVGPEAPLCAGAADALVQAGFAVYGPSRAAAQLEGSKAFLKRFATRHGIPTAPYDIVTNYAEAERAIESRGAPIVVKADGLCAGKGVVVAQTLAEAKEAARGMLVDRSFGDAGSTVILEEVIPGHEASVTVVSDGTRTLTLPVARDHKRLEDGDRGPNTGGMGVIAPTPLPAELLERIEREIVEPTVRGMREEGNPFVGTLFAGVMVTPSGDPMLLEHNVRFGDPESEALMAVLEGDMGELFASAAAGALRPESVTVTDRAAVVVVLAAAGYPKSPRKGDRISGIDAADAMDGVVVHHAGTALRDDSFVTAGGRVLAVTATGPDLEAARALAYRAADTIEFPGRQLRRDIGRT